MTKRVFLLAASACFIVVAPLSGATAASFKPGFKAGQQNNGGIQGGGPGASGTGDKASFKSGTFSSKNWGPGVGNSNPGQSKKAPGVRQMP